MKNKIIKNKFKLSDLIDPPLSKLDWLLFFIIAAICFITFQQPDLIHTGGSSIAYLNGHILDFYDYNVQYVGGNAYLPSTYIMFAIWNIPIYLLNILTLPGMRNVPWIAIMWFKLLPSIFYIISGYLIYKIGVDNGIGIKKSKMMAFIFLTAPLAIFSQFIFGQYDIFTVFFILLGLYFYFKNDMWKFIIFFGIAMTFKYFALLIFIPLLLLKEKNILKILRNGLLAALPLLVEILIYFKSTAFKSGVFGFNAKNYLFNAGFETTYTSISIVIVLFMVIVAWAYFTKIVDDKSLFKWSIYFSNIVLFLIFGLSMWHPQWLILAVPFMVISAIINKHFDTFMIIDIILMLVFTIFTVNFFVNNVDQQLMYFGIFKNMLNSNFGTVISMRSIFIINDQKLIFSTITGIFLINAIFKHPKYMIDKFDESIDKHWGLVRLRFLLGVAIWVIPSFIVLFVSLIV
ncbi:MAG: hypothetical protein L0Y48_02095 [Fusobacteria bacterium]|nr:hypothetical protein [Fusobacteriota bacterium]